MVGRADAARGVTGERVGASDRYGSGPANVHAWGWVVLGPLVLAGESLLCLGVFYELFHLSAGVMRRL